MIRTDILILGDGVAAYATALALVDKGVSGIVVAGRKGPLPYRPFTESLPVAAHTCLRVLGLESLMDNSPVGTRMSSVWGSDRIRIREPLFEPGSATWQVNKKDFITGLRRIVRQKGVSCLQTEALQESHPPDEKGLWNLVFRTEPKRSTQVQARFVVDATGRDSAFARRQGARKVLFDRQIAATGVFSAPPTGEDTTGSLVEALPGGWCYSGPLGEDRRFITFFTDPDILKEINIRKAEGWQSVLRSAEHTRSVLGNTLCPSQVFICSAATSLTEPGNSTGWLATGDAAMTFDPLSSGGLFFSLSGALRSASCIVDYLNGNQDSIPDFLRNRKLFFEDYLHRRSAMYRQESRWVQNKYWKRRHQPVTIDPFATLVLTPDTGVYQTVRQLRYFLTCTEWTDLFSVLVKAKKSYETVSEFLGIQPLISCQRVIEALQYLIDKKLLSVSARPDEALAGF